MRFLLLLLESSKRFNEFVIDDLDDVTNAPYHTCELCPAMIHWAQHNTCLEYM
jgi:hypothetical protein